MTTDIKHIDAREVIDFVSPMSFQGDVSIVALDTSVFTLNRTTEVAPKNHQLNLVEGEGFGNFHSVLLENHPRFGALSNSPSVAQIVKDALDGHAPADRKFAGVQELMDKANAGEITVATAKLYDDKALLDRLISDDRGPLTDTARQLYVGFLVVENGSMVLEHVKTDGTPTGEHAPIRLPEGTYFIGGQVESAFNEIRRVED